MTVQETIKYLDKQSLIQALWWFIENMDFDDPGQTEVFFYLRERVRAHQELKETK